MRHQLGTITKEKGPIEGCLKGRCSCNYSIGKAFLMEETVSAVNGNKYKREGANSNHGNFFAPRIACAFHIVLKRCCKKDAFWPLVSLFCLDAQNASAEKYKRAYAFNLM